jgi:hypothetical protein
MNGVTAVLHRSILVLPSGEEDSATVRAATTPPARHAGELGIKLLRALQSGLPAPLPDLARQALDKITSSSTLLASADSLEAGIEALMAQQSKQSEQGLQLARSRVMQKLAELRRKNLDEQRQIQKRLDAARSSGFWSKLVTFFKALGAALSAASSIFTGGAGIAAAALLVASIVVSAAKPDGWGQWLSLGLSLGAMALGGYASIASVIKTGAETVKSGLQLGLQIGGAVSQTTEAGCTITKGSYDSDGLLAQAALAELKAAKQKLLAEAGEDRDEMKLLIEAQDRCAKAVARALESNHAASMVALRRQP